MSDTMRDAFEAWWEEEGQFCRAGGGDYEKTFAFHAWQAAQSQPAPPVPQTVQEIMRLMNGYVRACVQFEEAGRPPESALEEDVAEEFKPLEAALTALVEKNHELQFSLDGVNAMRRLTNSHAAASFAEWAACRFPRGIPSSFDRSDCETAFTAGLITGEIHGIEPEQGGNHE